MAHHRPSDKETIDMKSAVISGAFEGLSKDEIDRFYNQNLSEVISKPKKGSFQITSVTSGSHVARDYDPGEDSQDDLDDTHTYTEDNMSMDWSKTTDPDPDKVQIVEEEPAVEETHTIHRPLPRTYDNVPQPKERSSTDNQSRFRVVKIATQEPFKRGRWTCIDSHPDPSKPNPENLDFRENRDHAVGTGSETSSAASSIHYVHGQDDPSKNPLATQTLTQTLTSPIYFDDQSKLQQQQPHPVLNGHDNLVYDHHENSNPAKTPDSFAPMNGNGGPSTLPYNTVQPPVHQASMQSTQAPLVSNPSLQPHSSSASQQVQIQGLAHTHSSHVLAPPPGENTMPNVLSNNYAMAAGGQGASNGPFAPEVSHSTPRLVSRAISIDKPPSRTHRISIGGEELDLSDDMGKAGILLEQIAGIPGALASPTKENDGEDSGQNSVAIDNKIEQAMDLVKSHLMFAVREEVEVLKEQITELEETKRKLEFENNFLKSVSSSDTLAKLAQAQAQHQQQSQQPNT